MGLGLGLDPGLFFKSFSLGNQEAMESLRSHTCTDESCYIARIRCCVLKLQQFLLQLLKQMQVLHRANKLEVHQLHDSLDESDSLEAFLRTFLAPDLDIFMRLLMVKCFQLSNI